jgi:hypothetical protein
MERRRLRRQDGGHLDGVTRVLLADQAIRRLLQRPDAFQEEDVRLIFRENPDDLRLSVGHRMLFYFYLRYLFTL